MLAPLAALALAAVLAGPPTLGLAASYVEHTSSVTQHFDAGKLVGTPASPAMVKDCQPTAPVRACNAASLVAINAARHQEGLANLVLPKNFSTLSYTAQLVEVTNVERTSRRLPALSGPRSAFDLMAQEAAARAADPSGPPGATWVSNMADGFRTPLEVDFQWMYNDGPGGDNLDCTATMTSGCWEHRRNILSPWPGGVGAAAQHLNGGGPLIFTELLVEKS